MNLDAKVIGQALQDVPLGHMVGNLGLAIADAQERLDGVAVAATLRMAQEKMTMLEADGQEVTRSLLELGFAPTFYQFTEANIEVAFIASMHVSEAIRVGFGFDVAGQITNAADAQAALANLEKQRKDIKDEEAERLKRVDADVREVGEKTRKLKDQWPKEGEQLSKVADTISNFGNKSASDDKAPVPGGGGGGGRDVA